MGQKTITLPPDKFVVDKYKLTPSRVFPDPAVELKFAIRKITKRILLYRRRIRGEGPRRRRLPPGGSWREVPPSGFSLGAPNQRVDSKLLSTSSKLSHSLQFPYYHSSIPTLVRVIA